MKTGILSLWLGATLAITTSAWADSSSATTPTSGGVQFSTTDLVKKVRENVRGTYQNWLRGPTVRTLSGNTAGEGANVLMTHYLALGYKAGSKWTITATQPFTQSIDDKPAAKKDPFVANDPYLTFTNSRVLHSDKYGANLYAYLRYYATVSRTSNRNIDKGHVDEAGGGQVRLYLSPTKTYFDGALTFNFQTLLQYRISTRGNIARVNDDGATGNNFRNNLVFVFDPVISYAINDTWEPYIEYAMDMTHSSGNSITSKWTSWKASDYGSVGVNATFSKKFILNPYLEFDPRAKEVKNTRIGLNTIYYFL